MKPKKRPKARKSVNTFLNSCTIVCKNMPGLGDKQAENRKRNFISRHLCDSIIMLQELKKGKHDDILHWFPASWHDNIKSSLIRDGSAGVLIAVNPKANIKIIKKYEIIPGRLLVLKIKWSDITMHIACLCSKSGGSKEDIAERTEIHNTINTHEAFGAPGKPLENLIIGGDWNCVQYAIDKWCLACQI